MLMVHLPDCMMPDGAEPCAAYQELQRRLETLEAETIERCALAVRKVSGMPSAYEDAIRNLRKLSLYKTGWGLPVNKCATEGCDRPAAICGTCMRNIEIRAKNSEALGDDYDK